jgi:hypothetical protein
MNEWEMEEASRSRRSTKQTREGAVEISFLSLLSLFLINNLVFFSLSIGHEHVPRHFFSFLFQKVKHCAWEARHGLPPRVA